MIYRKVAKFAAAAFVAATLSIGGSGTSAFAQQSIGVQYAPCANCSSTISFPSSNVSSMPIPGATMPTGDQTITYASGPAIVSGGMTSSPVGTFTSMPAPSYVPAASYVPVPSYVQPTRTYIQPTTAATPVYYRAVPSTPVRSTLSTGYQTLSTGISNVSSGLAQMKAQQAASGGIRGHIGGGLGGARYEGVGWSNQSPQAAIQQCCYWGTRPTAQIGVSKSADGCWYACVLYN